MSKSIILTIIAMVLGLGTIGVGLYVLSQTPVPVETIELESSSSSFVVMPKIEGQQKLNDDVPNAPIVRGTESWCDEMMLKADNQWHDRDAILFAKNCIYE